jgi:hypothetical protein
MSLVRLTAEGDVRVMKSWAKPAIYEAWLAMLPRGAYGRIIQTMNNKIDRMDVVRAQYVVCESAEKWFDEYEIVWQVMNEDKKLSGQFIGLILWDVMNSREEDWAFHKVDKTIVNELDMLEGIEVMEYFRVEGFPRSGRWRDTVAAR